MASLAIDSYECVESPVEFTLCLPGKAVWIGGAQLSNFVHQQYIILSVKVPSKFLLRVITIIIIIKYTLNWISRVTQWMWCTDPVELSDVSNDSQHFVVYSSLEWDLGSLSTHLHCPCLLLRTALSPSFYCPLSEPFVSSFVVKWSSSKSV